MRLKDECCRPNLELQCVRTLSLVGAQAEKSRNCRESCADRASYFLDTPLRSLPSGHNVLSLNGRIHSSLDLPQRSYQVEGILFRTEKYLPVSGGKEQPGPWSEFLALDPGAKALSRLASLHPSVARFRAD